MSINYLERVIDDMLKMQLEAMGAVLIVGPKWCGKTTTALQEAKSVLKMQDPDKKDAYLATAQTKPSLLLIGDNPRLIDEWQIAPVLWDAVRTTVDERNKEGLFILTGSTVVDESTIMHSGTGRISRMMMRPMSLYESLESNGKISLQQLFDDNSLEIDGVSSSLTIEQLIFSACRGGWPSSLNKKTERAQLFVANSYLDNICEHDVSSVDGIKKEPNKIRALLRSYGRNIATTATNKTILSDINTNFSMSETSLYKYLNALQRIFVIDDIPAWSPSIRSKTSIRSANKKMFIDPSIVVASLNLSPPLLMQDLHTFGFIFENLCIRDLKVYSNAMGGVVSYYHDRFGLEADAVLHLKDGRYALIEFKLGSKDIEKGAHHLLELGNLIREYNKKNKGSKLREPDLFIIITGGDMAYTRKDGVKIIPVGCLKD